MKIKTSKLNRVNQTVQLMAGVSVRFDEKLEAELEQEDKIKEIMKRDPSISIVGAEPEKPKAPEATIPDGMKEYTLTEEDILAYPELGKGVGEVIFIPIEDEGLIKEEEEEAEEPAAEATQEEEEKTAEEESDSKEEMKKFKMDELHELCKESDLPEADWKSLRKDDLVDYILEKTKG